MDSEGKFWAYLWTLVAIVTIASAGFGTSCYQVEIDAKREGGYYQKLDPHKVKRGSMREVQ